MGRKCRRREQYGDFLHIFEEPIVLCLLLLLLEIVLIIFLT